MKPVSGLLYSLFRGTPQHADWVIACLEGAWPKLVGDPLARVSRPAALRGSTLMIEIRDPAWEEALRSMRRDLQGRLERATDRAVTAVSFFCKE